MQTGNEVQRATRILMAEHEVILQVLDCLERAAHLAEGCGSLDVEVARDVLDFVSTFADGCHHRKEEECLFPSLVAKGMPRHVGPIAVMLGEHDTGREHIAAMKGALGAVPGDAAAVQLFVAHALRYVELMRDHIDKENGVLFPMADGMLSDVEQLQLLDGFGALEHRAGDGTHERYLALANDLARRLGVTPAPRAERTGGCCGHHGGCH